METTVLLSIIAFLFSVIAFLIWSYERDFRFLCNQLVNRITNVESGIGAVKAQNKGLMQFFRTIRPVKLIEPKKDKK